MKVSILFISCCSVTKLCPDPLLCVQMLTPVQMDPSGSNPIHIESKCRSNTNSSSSLMGSMVGWMVAHRKIHLCPNSWNLEPYSEKVIFTDVVSLRILRWSDCPGISIQSTKANVIHLYGKYTGEIWQTEEEEVIWPQRQIWGWCSHKATCQGMPTAGMKNRRDKGKLSPRASRSM